MIHRLFHHLGGTITRLVLEGWDERESTRQEVVGRGFSVLDTRTRVITVTTPASSKGYLAVLLANLMSSSISQGAQTRPLTLPLSFDLLVTTPICHGPPDPPTSRLTPPLCLSVPLLCV